MDLLTRFQKLDAACIKAETFAKAIAYEEAPDNRMELSVRYSATERAHGAYSFTGRRATQRSVDGPGPETGVIRPYRVTGVLPFAPAERTTARRLLPDADELEKRCAVAPCVWQKPPIKDSVPKPLPKKKPTQVCGPSLSAGRMAGRVLAPRLVKRPRKIQTIKVGTEKPPEPETGQPLLYPDISAVKKSIPSARILPLSTAKCTRSSDKIKHSQSQVARRKRSSSASSGESTVCSTRWSDESDRSARLGPGAYDVPAPVWGGRGLRWSNTPRFPRVRNASSTWSKVPQKRVVGGVIHPLHSIRRRKTERRQRDAIVANMPFRDCDRLRPKIQSFIFRPLAGGPSRATLVDDPTGSLGPGHYDVCHRSVEPASATGVVAWKPRKRAHGKYGQRTPGPGAYTISEIARRITCFKFRPISRAFRRRARPAADHRATYTPPTFGSSARAASLGQRWKATKRAIMPGPAAYDPQDAALRPYVGTKITRRSGTQRRARDARDFGAHKDHLTRPSHAGAPIYRTPSEGPRKKRVNDGRKWRFYDAARSSSSNVPTFSRRVPFDRWAAHENSIAQLRSHLEATRGRFSRRTYSLPELETTAARAPVISFSKVERNGFPSDRARNGDEVLILDPKRPEDAPPSCFVRFDRQQPKVAESLWVDPDAGNVLLLEPEKLRKHIPSFELAKQPVVSIQLEEEPRLVLSPKRTLTERRTKVYDFSKNLGRHNVDYRLMDDPNEEPMLLLYWSD